MAANLNFLMTCFLKIGGNLYQLKLPGHIPLKLAAGALLPPALGLDPTLGECAAPLLDPALGD